jgi:hypothetical protein
MLSASSDSVRVVGADRREQRARGIAVSLTVRRQERIVLEEVPVFITEVLLTQFDTLLGQVGWDRSP